MSRFPISLNVINIIVSLLYIFILIFPNFFLDSSWISILLLLSIYIFIYSITSLRIFYIITFPVLILSIVQTLFFSTIHKSLVSALLIEISLFQSNWTERMSIISNHTLLFFLGTALIILFWRYSKKIRVKRKFRYILMILVLFFSLLKTYETTGGIDYQRKQLDSKYNFKTIALLNVKEIFPLNFMRNIWTAYLTQKKSKYYFKNTKNFSFGYPKLDSNEEDIIVLIIGESSRASSFGLNNANLSTTPRLRKRKNLVSFKNVFTPYSSTSRSVPFSLSRVTLEKWKKNMYSEKSIVTAMKELGYATFTIDNQEVNRGLLDFYKKETDFYITTEIPMSYDENILPILDSIVVSNNSPKKFILIHSYGSHYIYSKRYPRKMAKYTPDQAENIDIKYKTEINNSYLNTINYVDFFLDEVIRELEPYKSSIIYYSDHGENLYDDDNELIFHGYTIPNKFTLNVPIIFWVSESKKADNPNILEIAKLNKNKLISTESIFPSVLALTKLDSSFIDKNIFRADFKAKPRVQYFDENNTLQNLTIDE